MLNNMFSNIKKIDYGNAARRLGVELSQAQGKLKTISEVEQVLINTLIQVDQSGNKDFIKRYQSILGWLGTERETINLYIIALNKAISNIYELETRRNNVDTVMSLGFPQMKKESDQLRCDLAKK